MMHGRTGTSCRRTGPLAMYVASGLVLFGLAFNVAVAGTASSPGNTQPVATGVTSAHPRYKTYLKRQWGIEIVFVRQTSAGYMLEFRYKVLDPDKARPLFERQTKPILTHEETGARMVVPTPAKTGALRNSNMPIENRIYWMFFANPGKLVDVGDTVTIEIGDFVVDGLVVE